MTKLAIAIVSFILGACISAAISTYLQDARAQDFSDMGVRGSAGTSFRLGNVEPIIPNSQMYTFKHVDFGRSYEQQLDGIDCEDCVVRTSILTYAGGNFRLGNTKIYALQLHFQGAAANTVRLLQQLGAYRMPENPFPFSPVPSGSKPPPPATRPNRRDKPLFRPPSFQMGANDVMANIEPEVSPITITIASAGQ